jgi:hypothetical protein
MMSTPTKPIFHGGAILLMADDNELPLFSGKSFKVPGREGPRRAARTRLKIKELEHVLIEKAVQLFLDML